MKRTILILLACAMAAGMLAGCQKKPESPLITGKNNEALILKAQSADDTSNIAFSAAQSDATQSDTVQSDATRFDAAQYGIPETLNFTQAAADGKLSINMSADVITPELPLPIVRVEAAQFSQETVTALYDAILGGTPMFETVTTLTKSEIEKLLVVLNGYLTDENASANDKEYAQQKIPELTAQYDTAPETIQSVPATSKLKLQAETFEEGAGGVAVNYYGLTANSADKVHHFSVANDRDNERTIEINDYDEEGNFLGGLIIPVARNAHLSYITKRQFPSNIGEDSLRLNRDDDLPEYAKPFLKSTPAEAAATAEGLLKKAGLNDILAVSEILLINNKSPRNGMPEPTAYAYYIHCTRMVEGVPCAIQSLDRDVRAPYWNYEICSFQIDDAGIYGFGWGAPMQINETVVESSTLMHFSEIESIVKKMLTVVHEPEARNEHIKTMELEIDSMELALHRIADKDAFDRGLLVPAWNVYGFMKRTGEDYTNAERRSLLTVNAIDGSIIDTAKGS